MLGLLFGPEKLVPALFCSSATIQRYRVLTRKRLPAQCQTTAGRRYLKRHLSIRAYKTGAHIMSNQVIERKPNGQFQKGVSGNVGGNAQRTRHIFNKAFLEALAKDFQEGGAQAI